MSWKENRFVSQVIHVICATCGKEIEINNRYKSNVFQLVGEELMFNCPKCNHSYDVPYQTHWGDFRKTWLDLVREYFPSATDKECDFILWEETAFPFCELDEIKKRLEDMRESKVNKNG